MMKFCLFSFYSAVVFFVAGCGPRTVTLSGKVTVNGQPVQNGIIDFAPLDKAPVSSPTEIINGQYKLQLFPGKKQVSISAPIVTDRRPEHPGPGAPIIEITTESLPPKFNSNSELTLEVAGTMSKDWDLKTP